MGNLTKKCVAEFIGTAVLVIFGCGVAAWTGASIVATSLAFGLVIVAMAYSIGNVSGCHINPAVSLGCYFSKRMSGKECAYYIVSQFLGGIFGALLLAAMLRSFDALGANQIQTTLYEAGSLDAASYICAIVGEIVLTATFVLTVLGVTDSRFKNGGIAGLVIGGALTLVHLLGLGLTGTSVNPARSFGPAVLQAFSGDTTALSQIWIFIVAPVIGAILAAFIYKLISDAKAKKANEAAVAEPIATEADKGE